MTRPASCHSRVIPVSRFVRARFNISVSPSLLVISASYLPAGGIKIRFLPISVPGFFSFALHGIRVSSVSSFGSCQFSSILFLSLFLSLSLSFSLSLSLGGFEKESRLTSVVRPIRGDRSSRLALRARVRRTIRNERIRNRIGI